MAEFDYKEYARQLRENAVKDDNGVIRCSPALWEQIVSIIDNIPTADVVEVKHGKWEGCECSLCGHFATYANDYNYCPNCGAKMDGKDTNVST